MVAYGAPESAPKPKDVETLVVQAENVVNLISSDDDESVPTSDHGVDDDDDNEGDEDSDFE